MNSLEAIFRWFSKQKVFEQPARVYRTIPAYHTLYKNKGFKPSRSVSCVQFQQKVPIIEKKDLFAKFTPQELVPAHILNDARDIVMESEDEGVFSYSIETSGGSLRARHASDKILERSFTIKKGKTLVVNALSRDVPFSTSFSSVSVGAHFEQVIYAINTFQNVFDSFIIVTNSYTAKEICEYGKIQVDWKKLNVSYVINESYVSDSFKQYMCSFGVCAVSVVGIPEVGPHIFFQTEMLAEERHVLQEQFEKGQIAPLFAYYDPYDIFIEVINEDEAGIGDIVVTTLGEHRAIPFVRYNTKRKGRLVDPLSLKNKPDAALPIVALYGHDTLKSVIKEMLYNDEFFAENITGQFTVVMDMLLVQLDKHADETRIQLFSNVLAELCQTYNISLAPKVVTYREYF